MVRALSDIWRFKYSVIEYVAYLLAELSDWYEHVVIAVVDNVLEDVRRGMEVCLL